jgi:hypothetical protein
MMRIKYLTETEIMIEKFKSELNNQVYEPETYFINNLQCIDK